MLEQAADWMLRLHSDDVDEDVLAACEAWRRAAPAHAQAWARVERLQQLIGTIPREVALPALGDAALESRRATLKRLALLATAVPGAWLAVELSERQGWQADERTATGERRGLHLPDGSRVELNTATALDIRFDSGQRRLHLHRGEILVETAPDPQAPARPFTVSTRSGRLQALGTRFSARTGTPDDRVAVLEGAVRVDPAAGGRSAVIHAGQQAGFGVSGVLPAKPADEAIVAWRHGMIAADRMPMGELVAELARHRGGALRCDPGLAALPVSGAFPLDDIDLSLRMLEATWPVRVRRSSGWWLVVEPERPGKPQ
ncbi:MAG: FecR family protein [Luteimonas sp.]